jgi:hypothetical protein
LPKSCSISAWSALSVAFHAASAASVLALYAGVFVFQ